jgi:hypothetical protein
VEQSEEIELMHDFLGDTTDPEKLQECMISETTGNFQSYFIYHFDTFLLGRFFV